jgi:Icc-related predicted phosphoesterase
MTTGNCALSSLEGAFNYKANGQGESEHNTMRLLLFSDLHADGEAALSLASRAFEFDVLVGAGDFAQARRGLNLVLPIFKTLAVPMVFVAGNNESFEELRDACSDAPHIHVLHGDAVELAGQTFFGLGGGVPVTPFGPWSFDLSEEEAELKLRDCPRDAILVSHSPPLGTLDVSSAGKHLGSQSVARCIEEKAPKLAVCGHIHASAGKSEPIGNTTVVNAGPIGIAWELK